MVFDCSDRLWSPEKECLNLVFMVFFCVLLFVSVYRPSTEKTAKQGGQRE